MPMKREESGRRSVEMDLEVPGTPEQVWEAVATGPGISSWFVRTEVEEREGGRMLFDFGPGLQSPATVTTWDAPRVFAYEERDWLPGAPPVATEITIEARAGGTCIVRMVHSLFASVDDWDDQLASFEKGWPVFFEILKLRLSRYAGEPFAAVRVTRSLDIPEADAWTALARDLGLLEASAGQRVESRPGAPAFAGGVRHIIADKHHEAFVDLDRPATGVALVQLYRWAETGSMSIALYLFGADAPAVAAQEQEGWQAWCDGLFGALAAGSAR
jgi:uncharacterized protein YndB with AHSA1/START domain